MVPQGAYINKMQYDIYWHSVRIRYRAVYAYVRAPTGAYCRKYTSGSFDIGYLFGKHVQIYMLFAMNNISLEVITQILCLLRQYRFLVFTIGAGITGT